MKNSFFFARPSSRDWLAAMWVKIREARARKHLPQIRLIRTIINHGAAHGRCRLRQCSSTIGFDLRDSAARGSGSPGSPRPKPGGRCLAKTPASRSGQKGCRGPRKRGGTETAAANVHGLRCHRLACGTDLKLTPQSTASASGSVGRPRSGTRKRGGGGWDKPVARFLLSSNAAYLHFSN